KALIPPPPERPDSPETQPGPRIMHSATAPRFQRLRCLMEGQWIPQMMDAVALTQDALPIVRDGDFLYGPKTATFFASSMSETPFLSPTKHPMPSPGLFGRG